MGFLLGFFGLTLLALFGFSQAAKERADILARQGRFAEAAQLLKKHLVLSPADYEALLQCGLYTQMAGDIHGAEQAFQQAVEHRPDESLARFRLARVKYLLGKFDEGHQHARASLELGGSPAYVYNLIGLIFEEKHSYPKALQAYKRAMHESPQEFAEPFINAGILLLRLNRLSEALQTLSSAISANPRSAEAFFQRARAHLELNHLEQAKADLARASSLGESESANRLLNQLRAGGIQSRRRKSKAISSLTPIRVENVAQRAGLAFVLENHLTPEKRIIETMPGGVAAFDYNNDGLTDVYFANGAEIPQMEKTSAKYWNRLYRNEGGMKFTDVTESAGVGGAGYSMGVAAADYDNDGNVDLFVAGVNRNILFRNTGAGTFEEVTAESRIHNEPWSVAAAWFDYDIDGWLDLFVVNYLNWPPKKEIFCGDPSGRIRTYCDPSHYEGLPNRLYRNRGDGTFEDVSDRASIAKHIGKGMSVAFADYDLDGYMDVFVTNDTVPNFLFHNRGDGTFEETALTAGVAVTDDGKAISSMGVDFRDYDNDGLDDIAVTALARETFPLFQNQGEGFFRDVTYPSRMGMLSAGRSGWSNGLFDLNNNGWKDLFSVNSHVMDNIEQFRPDSYEEPNSIFANLGDGTFRDISEEVGNDFLQPRAHRGAAVADFNNDGRLDIVVSCLGRPAELWQNVSPGTNSWLLLKLHGTASNRDGIGAKITIGEQHNHMTTSVGYASSSHHGVHFGLGKVDHVGKIRIVWPSGTVQLLEGIPSNQTLVVQEPLEENTQRGSPSDY